MLRGGWESTQGAGPAPSGKRRFWLRFGPFGATSVVPPTEAPGGEIPAPQEDSTEPPSLPPGRPAASPPAAQGLPPGHPGLPPRPARISSASAEGAEDELVDERVGLVLGYARLVQPDVSVRFVGFDFAGASQDFNGDGVNDNPSFGFEVEEQGGTDVRDTINGTLHLKLCETRFVKCGCRTSKNNP